MLSAWRREDNYEEYLRLLQNEDYLDVTYDEKSGGVSAVHRLHKFGKQPGVCGMRRGDYERAVLAILRKNGHRIVLSEETNIPGIKSFDGYLDDVPVEIKTIEGTGTWSVCSKIRFAVKQRAECVVLFFPKEELYSPFRISEGLRLFQTAAENEIPKRLKILIVVKDRLVVVWDDKKAAPIKGRSI